MPPAARGACSLIVRAKLAGNNYFKTLSLLTFTLFASLIFFILKDKFTKNLRD